MHRPIETKRQPLSPGAGLALISAILFGASTPLAKVLLDNVEPWLLAALLYLGSGVGPHDDKIFNRFDRIFRLRDGRLASTTDNVGGLTPVPPG